MKEGRLRLFVTVTVLLLLAISASSAFFYSELTVKRDTLYRVEYEQMDALAQGLAEMENTIMATLDEQPSRQDALNQSWMVYSGANLVYFSIEALVVEFKASSDERRVLEHLQHSVALVSDAFREWIEMPLWTNVTLGNPFLLDPTVDAAFRDTVVNIDVVRLEASIFEIGDHPYSRLSLMDFDLVDSSSYNITAIVEGLGSPP